MSVFFVVVVLTQRITREKGLSLLSVAHGFFPLATLVVRKWVMVKQQQQQPKCTTEKWLLPAFFTVLSTVFDEKRRQHGAVLHQ
jgi:hypothetical protein